MKRTAHSSTNRASIVVSSTAAGTPRSGGSFRDIRSVRATVAKSSTGMRCAQIRAATLESGLSMRSWASCRVGITRRFWFDNISSARIRSLSSGSPLILRVFLLLARPVMLWDSSAAEQPPGVGGPPLAMVELVLAAAGRDDWEEERDNKPFPERRALFLMGSVVMAVVRASMPMVWDFFRLFGLDENTSSRPETAFATAGCGVCGTLMLICMLCTVSLLDSILLSTPSVEAASLGFAKSLLL
mmetsp:Transcript_124820/g.388562  ORF Transcript_124820/g.388562 Transcript_124820/m.388562 type:complete len:243 (-) Transcript_124820:43-771(-)